MTVQTYEAGLMTEQEFNQKLINHVKRGELWQKTKTKHVTKNS
jgi:hypothetical protein